MAVMELEYRQDGNPEEEGGRIVVDNTEDLKSAITKDKGTKELFD